MRQRKQARRTIRLDHILNIIRDCKYGVHDISKTELDSKSKLPRFNMPLELGMFLAAQRFGGTSQRGKKCIIFDRKPYRFQKFISDIAGQDIHSHNKSRKTLVQELATWLRHEVRQRKIPGGRAIAKEYQLFKNTFPTICQAAGLDPTEVSFKDYRSMVTEWITQEFPPTGLRWAGRR